MTGIGPRVEKLAIARVLLVAAATESPFTQAALLTVPPPPLLPAAVTGRMFAFNAQASMACWLMSVGLGLDPYDMLPATMLNLTLSAAACCQAAASVMNEEPHPVPKSQME
jgi:hypothetical protein